MYSECVTVVFLPNIFTYLPSYQSLTAKSPLPKKARVSTRLVLYLMYGSSVCKGTINVAYPYRAGTVRMLYRSLKQLTLVYRRYTCAYLGRNL